MTKENKVLIGLISISTIIILALGTVLVTKTQSPVLDDTGSARVEITGEKAHAWGEIDINGGHVEQIFQIKNVGDSDLEITNFKTSCMCTEAQVNIDGKNSPIFGMHTRSGWSGVVRPGETADVNVVFDPMYHGPQGTGPITRMVSFNTNDSDNRIIEFTLTGDVVSIKN